MRIVSTLLNRPEEVVFRELKNIASDNNLHVFAKTRLSDVLQKNKTYLTQREFEFYTKAHCDFVLTDSAFKPIAVIEYDGPLHADERQQERDEIKNSLCRNAELGLLRINDRHVTRYRGMSVLRWIVEVTELQKAFYEAQADGQVPADEPFDPMFIDIGGCQKRFPYWLSAPANQSFHDFFKTLDRQKPKGWNSIVGSDQKGVDYRLSCLFFDDKILVAKNAIRQQDMDFPHYDLLDEINTCELGILLSKYRKGEIVPLTKAEFEPKFKEFTRKYNARGSHSMGAFPIPCTWDFTNGFKFQD